MRGFRTAFAALTGILTIVMVQPATAQNEKPDWDVSVALGLSVTRGNSDTLLGNASVTATRENDPHAIQFNAQGAYGKTEVKDADDDSAVDETTTDNAKLVASYKRRLNGHFLYANGSVFRDKVANVDMRAIAGVGAGYFVIDTDSTRLSTEAGVGYLVEEVGDTRDDYPVIRLAERIDQNLSEYAKAWQTLEYLPKASDLNEYLLNAEIGVEAPLSVQLNLRVVLQDRYDSNPDEDRDNNDLSLISYLSWTL